MKVPLGKFSRGGGGGGGLFSWAKDRKQKQSEVNYQNESIAVQLKGNK